MIHRRLRNLARLGRPLSLLATALALVVWSSAGPARALDSCSLPDIGALVFGSYDPILGGAVDVTGSITYHCTGSAETITISLDSGTAASFSPRTQTSGSHTLDYNLYLDAARTIVWGDGSSGTSTFQDTAVVNQNTTLTIYGRIFGGQNAYEGSYSDAIVVTISY